jgi:hypothetical protein
VLINVINKAIINTAKKFLFHHPIL